MSLLRYLLLSVTMAVVAILAGAVWLSVDSARHYLSTQLQAQSDSAATSLALTLSQPANHDPVIQELLVSALFDTGQFHRVELLDSAGNSLVQRVNTRPTEPFAAAPQWFSNSVPLRHSDSVAHVSDGWRQLGQVVVQADAAHARDTLWKNFLSMTMWVAAAGVLWACLVVMLMRWLRRALRTDVEERVAGILSQQPPPTASRSRSRFAELEGLSQTIEAVQKRVLATSQEQHARIESLEFELHQDEVTGLANRRYFLNELRKALAPNGDASKTTGHILLFRQRDLAAINTVMSRVHVDGWLRNVGDQLRACLQAEHIKSAQLARLNGSDFAVLLPGLDGPQVSPIAEQLKHRLAQLRVQLPSGQFCRWAVGLTDYEAGDGLAVVLGRLDQALMAAESAGHSDIEYLSRRDSANQGGTQGAGETQWRQLLQNALIEQRFELTVQPHQASEAAQCFDATLVIRQAADTKASANPLSALSAQRGERAGDEQPASYISAFLFMPVAVRLGLSAVCDLRAIELAGHWLQQNSGELVLRVSLTSLLQDGFMNEAEQCLKAMDADFSRLYIELDAYGVTSHSEALTQFVQRLSPLGVRFGLRRLVEHPTALSHLQPLSLSYVRANAAFIQEQAATVGGHELALAVFKTCAALNIHISFDMPCDQLPEQLRLLVQESAVKPTT